VITSLPIYQNIITKSKNQREVHKFMISQMNLKNKLNTVIIYLIFNIYRS